MSNKMGMTSWICKGCGEELCEGELCHINNAVVEFDGYSGHYDEYRYSGHYDEYSGGEAWHKRCHDHASQTSRLDGKPSKSAPNQGFGPSKLEAVAKFDPNAETRYSAEVDAHYYKWDEETGKILVFIEALFYLTENGFEDREQWRKDREDASDSINTDDSPAYTGVPGHEMEVYEAYWKEHGEKVDAAVGTDPGYRTKFFDTIEEAVAAVDSLLSTLPERLEGQHTLIVYGKQEQAEGAVYQRSRQRYDKELAEEYGEPKQDAEDGQLFDEVKDWTGLAQRSMGRDPVFDRFDNELFTGDFLDVQKAGIFKTFEYKDELCFTPYGKIERVRDYFKNDFWKVEVDDLEDRPTG